MIFKIRGISAILISLGILLVVLLIIALAIKLFIILIPVIIVIALMYYFFKVLNKLKKGTKKDFVDAKFKIRE